LIKLKTKNTKIKQGEILFELGQDFIYFIVRVSASARSIYSFSAIATSTTILIQKRVLGCTSAFKLAVFNEEKSHRHQDKEQSDKAKS
jgi:hypothetical protein